MIGTYFNPLEKVLGQVSDFYIAHPDLLELLVAKLGADRIKHRWGHEIRSTCPLHSGSNDQGFVVYYDQGYIAWQCFSGSCGRGNLLKLIQEKYQNSSPQQAVTSLGRFAGITIDGSVMHVSADVIQQGTMDLVTRRLGLNKEAVSKKINVFPEAMVVSSVNRLAGPDGTLPLKYLCSPTSQKVGVHKCRAIPAHILQQFQVGFVRAREWIWKDKITEKDAGYFEDRITIPWRYVDATLMGFAGRRFDDSDHMKYKTLPGTMRALMLFGLHDQKCQSEIRRTGTLHLVEGYTDVFRGHQHSCHNIAAVGGTSLTEEQQTLLSKLGVQRVIYFRDGDHAGDLASKSLAKDLNKYLRFEVAHPPAGKDPDELEDYRDFWTPILQAEPLPTSSFQ